MVTDRCGTGWRLVASNSCHRQHTSVVAVHHALQCFCTSLRSRRPFDCLLVAGSIIAAVSPTYGVMILARVSTSSRSRCRIK